MWSSRFAMGFPSSVFSSAPLWVSTWNKGWFSLKNLGLAEPVTTTSKCSSQSRFLSDPVLPPIRKFITMFV